MCTDTCCLLLCHPLAECSAGYGNGAASCTPCGYGTFQPGYTGAAIGSIGDGETCIACESTVYKFVSNTGDQAPLKSAGMTLYQLSSGPEACVPRFQQLAADAGRTFKLVWKEAWKEDLSATSAEACVETCLKETESNEKYPVACFVQFEYTGAETEDGVCKRATLEAVSVKLLEDVLLVKLSPSDSEAAAKNKPSGIYARLRGAEGGSYGIEISTMGGTEAECREKCNSDSSCWAVHMKSEKECMLLTGDDQRDADARSVYVNPAPGDVLQALNW